LLIVGTISAPSLGGPPGGAHYYVRGVQQGSSTVPVSIPHPCEYDENTYIKKISEELYQISNYFVLREPMVESKETEDIN
jgi:hypothetical protein